MSVLKVDITRKALVFSISIIDKMLWEENSSSKKITYLK